MHRAPPVREVQVPDLRFLAARAAWLRQVPQRAVPVVHLRGPQVPVVQYRQLARLVLAARQRLQAAPAV